MPWQRSAPADLALNHFNWVPALALCLAVDRWPSVWGAYALVGIATFFGLFHRWITYPYAYLNEDVRRRLPIPLLAVPALLLLIFLSLPFTVPSLENQAGLNLETQVFYLTMIAAYWNSWHTARQKYGLLRFYSRSNPMPKFYDGLFFFGCYGLLITCMLLRLEYENPSSWIEHLVFFLHENKNWLLTPVAVAFTLPIIFRFIVEWKTSVLRNPPRWSFLISQVMLFTVLAASPPVQALVILAVNHAVEYIFFVQNTNRQRANTKARSFLMPLAYLSIPLAIFALSRGWMPDTEAAIAIDLVVAGLSFKAWFLFGAALSSMGHYYLDTVLWKTRNPISR